MSLVPGTRLGPYEVLSAVGAGGMGEVYRARDTRLGRDVAIKVLSESVGRDADRIERFEREARAIAALSDPHICAVYDVGHDQERHYLVMELLDGETLRERLKAGPIPIRKCVDIGVQTARGLAAAHARGFVHRDLKPENLFLLREGQVKILDFGLARHASPEASGATETAAALTDPGVAMGTVGYMAPEQVRAQPVDARTDLFALGAVLYELLSGQRAFKRETPAETMTAILNEDPPELTGSRAELSPALDRIVRRCLEKNPAERFQNARDLAFALEAFSGATGAGSGAVPARPVPRNRVSYVVVAAVALAALGGGALIDHAQRRAPASISFVTKTWDEQWITNARFAPDGQTIVYSAVREGGAPSLYTIPAGTLTSQPVGEPGTHLLAISSKGELAVITNARQPNHRVFQGTLARMTMDGAPRPWLENVLEADWSPDGATVAVTRRVGSAVQLEYPVGHRLYEILHGYLSDLRVSPDGTRVAFFEHQTFGDDRGWVKVVAASGAPKTLAGEYFGLEGLAWSADGRSIYYSGSAGGSELYQPLVVNVEGTPSPHQAIASAGSMYVQDVARDGRLLVERRDGRQLVRALLPGETTERDFPWLDLSFRGLLTHDHKSLVFADESQSAGPNYAVALRDLATSRVTRLGEGNAMSVSPDDKWAAALIESPEQVVLYPIGTGDPIKLPRGSIEHYVLGLQWFKDSARVFLCGSEKGKDSRCYEQDIHGGLPKPATPEEIIWALLNPDGRTLLAWHEDRAWEITTLGGVSGEPVKGLPTGARPVTWATNGREVVVQSTFVPPLRIEQLDPWTGARKLLRVVGPADRPGVTFAALDQWIDDGRGYTMNYSLRLSRLFVASGVGQ